MADQSKRILLKCKLCQRLLSTRVARNWWQSEDARCCGYSVAAWIGDDGTIRLDGAGTMEVDRANQ